MIKELMNFG